MLIQNVSNRLLGRIVIFALCISAACSIFASAAHAQTVNQKSKVTFSQPVEIPDVGAQVLPAGTYVFKLVDSTSDRHIVQVFSQDEKHLFATILAVPNYRLKPTDHTVITFTERASDSPQAIRAWFYPGKNWGQEFVYPKKRALALAQATNQPVLFMPSEVPQNMDTSATAKTDTDDEAALRSAPVRAFDSAGADVPMSDVVQAPPESEMAAAAPAPSSPSADTTADKSLPKTASDLPLIGLLGLASICAALGLKRASSR